MKKIKVLLADPRHETVGTHSYFVPIGIGYIGSNLLKEFKNNNLQIDLSNKSLKNNCCHIRIRNTNISFIKNVKI